MNHIAVFVNDVATARRILQPMREVEGPTHWVLVACPPALPRHIGRWVMPGARRQWRERWAAELFDALQPELQVRTDGRIETLIAEKALAGVSSRLLMRIPQLRLVDARRPRAGRVDEPISAAQPAQTGSAWAAPVAATAGLALMLALAD